MHDVLQTSLEKHLSGEKFLFYSEIVRHLAETNIIQLEFTLEKLLVLDIDQGLLYFGMFVKKILFSVKYIDVYPTADGFIGSSFKLVPICKSHLMIFSKLQGKVQHKQDPSIGDSPEFLTKFGRNLPELRKYN